MLGLRHPEARADVAAEERLQEELALAAIGVGEQELHVARVGRLGVDGEVAERAPPERLAHAAEPVEREPEAAVVGGEVRVPQAEPAGPRAGLVHRREERGEVARQQEPLERDQLRLDERADPAEDGVEVGHHATR